MQYRALVLGIVLSLLQACAGSGPNVGGLGGDGGVCVGETDAELCAKEGKTCGAAGLTDRCGVLRRVDCGTCPEGQTCGAQSSNVCGSGPCQPETDQQFCARLGLNCGAVTDFDNCGNARTVGFCGKCTSPQTCGGGGTDNLCGCGESDANICARLGKNCGPMQVTDVCGAQRTVSCGTCGTHAQCGEQTANICGCSEGYLGDGVTCVAAPKCDESSCQLHAVCSVEDHRITCTCEDPYIQDPANAKLCKPKNNCVEDTECGANTTCLPTTTAMPTCACKEGYTYETGSIKACRPFKTCVTDSCGTNSICMDQKDPTDSTKFVNDRVCACDTGYASPTNDGLACVDINECVSNNSGCSVNATCTNIPGSYTCACNTGYTSSGPMCTPINVCAGGSNPCDATSSTCSFTGPGTYACTCKMGYDTPTQTGCSLIDQCARHTDNCDAMSTTCSYTGPGTFSCVCKTDYENPTGTSCAPINRCSAGHTNSCVTSTSTCHYLGPNSYDCQCKNGFQHTTSNGQPDPYICEDINECTSYGPNSTQTCSDNAKCTNTVPGFTCACNDGFFGTGSYSASGPTCLPRYTQVAVGNQHICAIRADTAGTLVCWGANTLGQRGDGNPQACTGSCLSTPVPVSMTPITQWETNHGGSSSWIKIAAGGDTTCGIRANGDLWCWGGNSYGQIGNNQKASIVALPVLVASGTKWSDISIETDHSFGVSTITGGNGQGFAWGQNMDYQLGTGDATEHLTPTAINLSAPPTGPNFWSIGAGYLHGCGLDTLGRIYCWGSNTYGQLGQPYDSSSPNYLPYTSTPTLIQAANPMGSSLTSTGSWDRYFPGYFSNCAMQADSTTSGSLWCWGSNVSGQLGDKTLTNRPQPVPVRNITNGVDSWWLGTVNNVPVQSVALGEAHTCGIKSDQSIACWGNNTNNQLGLGMGGPTSQLYPTPITLPAGLPSSMHFIRISARKSITCAISEDPGQVPQSNYDKRLFCWGGPISTATLGYGPTPTEIKK